MATETKPETSVAMERVEHMDADGRRVLAEIRAKNALVVAITNEAWGNAMTPVMRRAFAEYMRRFHLDVSEIDNLGGRPYRNGYYYRRRVAELRTKGLVDWTAGDHIGPDPRLDALADGGDEWAKEERTRRLRERIRWAVPDDATHAYVVRIKVKGDQNPLEGCDFITPKRMKSTKYGDKIADPVGAAEPEKTVITRAWRRAGLLAAAEVPELHDDEAAMDAAAVEVSGQVTEIAAENARVDEAARIDPKALPAVSPVDPYAADSTQAAQSAPRGAPVKAETAKPVTDAVRARADDAAAAPDPYHGNEMDLDDRRFEDDE